MRRMDVTTRTGYQVLDLTPIGENVKAGYTRVGDIWDSLAGIASNAGEIAAKSDEYLAVVKDIPTFYAQMRAEFAKIQAMIETTRNVSIATAVGLGTVGLFFLFKPQKGG